MRIHSPVRIHIKIIITSHLNDPDRYILYLNFSRLGSGGGCLGVVEPVDQTVHGGGGAAAPAATRAPHRDVRGLRGLAARLATRLHTHKR